MDSRNAIIVPNQSFPVKHWERRKSKHKTKPTPLTQIICLKELYSPVLLLASPKATKAHHLSHLRVFEIQLFVLFLLLLLLSFRLLLLSLSPRFVILSQTRGNGGGGAQLSASGRTVITILTMSNTKQGAKWRSLKYQLLVRLDKQRRGVIWYDLLLIP